jgi:flavin-dependent dehydrogenase
VEADTYDLIVAGAGPAGCACAITAARSGGRVLLLEKDKFPRHKVCGEFVSPESLDLLGSLIGTGQFASSPLIHHARLLTNSRAISLPISPAARSITRFHLDDALLRAAQSAGVEALEEVTVSEVQRDGIFRVLASAGEFKGRAVVNTTGRWSRLTPAISGTGPRWIGLKAHFRELSPPDSVDLYFFSGGYCGVQPVDENTVNACAMVRADQARSLDQVFCLQRQLQKRAESWQPMWEPISTSALYFREPETERQGVLLAGDAAAFIDPFVGDGISLALHSGTLAAECLTPLIRRTGGLEAAAQDYDLQYRKRFAAAFRNAARFRYLLSTPQWLSSRLVTLAGIRPLGKLLLQATRAKS